MIFKKIIFRRMKKKLAEAQIDKSISLFLISRYGNDLKLIFPSSVEAQREKREEKKIKF